MEKISLDALREILTLLLGAKIGTDITINAVHCQLRKMHVKGEIERLETGTKLFKSGVYWRKKQC